ncbi:MAG: SWIM zinc finger family protein, partial [Candidatus Izemoplasmatales bacterium]|nr:SWIM zinc finger family protein [Candidatus Izemoplasmatales bacterium]
MKLHKFEQYINQDILSRGYAYFRENRVNHLKKIGRTYTAQVNGNNIYSVSIETDENSTIHQASCDCPHDAEICKHIVAVMYMITKEAYENTHLIHYQSVLGYLGTLTKDEILNWLKERLVNNLELANQWAIHTSNYSNDSDVVRMAIEFIRQDQIRLDRIKHKNEYQVSYDEIEEATKHFDELIELAKTHSNPVTALKLYLMLYETIDEYQTSPSLSDS